MDNGKEAFFLTFWEILFPTKTGYILLWIITFASELNEFIKIKQVKILI